MSKSDEWRSEATSTQQISRRTLIRLTGVGVAAGALAACGPSLSSKASAKNASAGGKVTLRYWTFMKSGTSDDPRTKAQGMILDAFRKAHPDIAVVEELVPWDQLQRQFMQAAAGGKSPDVSRQLDSSIGTLVDAKAISSLDPYVNSWSDTEKKDFMYSWDDTVFSSHKYALRQSLRIANMNFYRPGMFKSAGIETLPTTMTEFTQAVREVTRAPISGFLMPFSKSDNLNRFLQTTPPLLWAMGSDFVDLQTGQPTFNGEAGKQLFQWFQDLVYKEDVSPKGEVTMDSETAGRLFAGGTLASTWHHTSQWSEWSALAKTPIGLDTTTQPNPTGSSSLVPASTQGGWTLVMGKDAKKDAAWKLISFITSKEAELIDAKIAGELPTRASTLDADPFFKSNEFARQRKWLQYLRENSHTGTTIKIKNLPALADALGDAVQEIIGNRANVGSMLDAAAHRYSAQV